MGWFDPKVTTTVKSLSMRMLDDSAFKPSAQQAVAHWLYDTDPLSDMFSRPKLNNYLEEYANNSLPKQYDKLYRFAKRQDKYIFGTPSGSVIKDPKKALINQVLTEQNISSDEVIASQVSGTDGLYTALLHLQELGYDSKNNTLNLEQHNWTVDSITIGLDANNYREDNKETINIIGLPLAINLTKSNQLTLALSRKETKQDNQDNQDEQETIKLNKTIQLMITATKQDHIYIAYKRQGRLYYIDHVIDTNSYGVFDVQSVIGDYYPRVYFRVNQVDIVEHTDALYKKHTKNALRKVNMPLEGVTKQLQSGMGENYKDVRSIFMYMGARLKEVTQPIIAKYLFHYIDRLYQITQDKEFIQVIEDNICKQTLIVKGIKRQVKQGQFNNLANNHYGGSYSKGRDAIVMVDIQQVIPKIPSVFKVVKQENGQYIEYNIDDIRLIIEVAGFSATHTLGDDELVIPVDKLLVKTLSPKEQEWLLHKCLHIHILLVNEQKQKWWETNLFKAVMFAVGVALTVAFPPAGAGMTALIKVVAIASLKSIAVGVFTQTLVDTLVATGVVDAKTGVILVTLANVAYVGFAGGGFNFANLTTAPNMMRMINGAFDAYGKILAIDTQEVQKKYLQFEEKNKERQAKLKDTQRLLDTGVFTPSQELLKSIYRPQVDLFDTPELFYSRHFNYNVVGITLGSVSNFVAMRLNDKTSNIIPANTDETIHTPLYL